jgi:hypothetical protein
MATFASSTAEWDQADPSAEDVLASMESPTCYDDENKDFAMRKHQVDMTRLHYRDVDKWPGYIWPGYICMHRALHNGDYTGTCAGSYTQYLNQTSIAMK